MADLPTPVAGRTRPQHQADHNHIAADHNLFDFAAAPSIGDTWTWNGAKWVPGAGGGGGGGVVASVAPGAGIDVDATDPANPIVSAVGILTTVRHKLSWDSPVNTFAHRSDLRVPYDLTETHVDELVVAGQVAPGGTITLWAESYQPFSAGTMVVNSALTLLNITNFDGSQHLQAHVTHDGPLPSIGGVVNDRYGHAAFTGLWIVDDSAGGDLSITAGGNIESAAGGVYIATATVAISVAGLAP